MFEEYFPLIYAGIFTAASAYGLKWFLHYKKAAMQIQAKGKQGTIQTGFKGMVNNIMGVVDNPQPAYQELLKQIEQQRKAGVKEEQMKGLYDYKKMLEWIMANQHIMQFAKPILPIAGDMVDTIANSLKKVIKF